MRVNITKHCISALFAVAAIGCTPPPSENAKPTLLVTTAPLAMIVQPLLGEAATIHTLVPPGQSPHTYAPRPSDARAAEDARALLIVHPDLDGWASRLPVSESIALTKWLSEDAMHADTEHGRNPHVWMDPLLVRDCIEPLSTELVRLFPESAETIRANATIFMEKLNALDKELTELLAPHAGKSVVAVHGSFDYLIERYGLRVAGLLEVAPGQEPSPRHVRELVRRIEQHDVRAVIVEPQLSPRGAEVLAQETGAKLVELDPLGGLAPGDDYVGFIRWNAQRLAEALE